MDKEMVKKAKSQVKALVKRTGRNLRLAENSISTVIELVKDANGFMHENKLSIYDI